MHLSTVSMAALLCVSGSLALAEPASSPPAVPPASTEGFELEGTVSPKVVTPIEKVEVRGTGPVPMVLVPGVGCEWSVFESFMERNKDRYTMYAVTLPGFGGTTAPPQSSLETLDEGPWLENAVAAIMRVIDDKKLDKPVVVGHSMGSHLALRLAIRHGDRLRGVVSLDGTPAFPLADLKTTMTKEMRFRTVQQQIAPYFTQMSDPMWKGQQASMGATMAKSPEDSQRVSAIMSAAPKETTQRYIMELMAADIVADLSKITIPVLHISCITDEEMAVDKTELKGWVVDSFKDSPLTDVVFFEDTRHFVMWDAPVELDAAIAAFVGGQPVQGKPAARRAPGSTPAPAPGSSPAGAPKAPASN